MIQIDSPDDYPKLSDPMVSPLVRRYLTDYVDSLLADYSLPDLSEIGSVFLLQTEQDMQNYQAIGLSQPFDTALNEYSEILVLKGGGLTDRLIQSVYIVTDSYGISAVFPYDFVPDHTKSHLLKKLNGIREIDYDKERIG